MSFSPAAEPTKLIFNFLSLIRRGSSYGPLGLYATVLRGFIALVAERTRCSIVSRLYYIATRNTVLSSLPSPVLSSLSLSLSHSLFLSRYLSISLDLLIAPTSHVRQSGGTRPLATGRTCQHGELTAEEPIIQR